MQIEKYVDTDLLEKFEFYSYGHALEILHDAFPEEWRELQECLRKLKLTIADIKKAGGNESPIPKKFDDVLYPYGWREIRISGDLLVKKYPRQVAQRRGRFATEPYETELIEGYIDGHNIDFLKNRVAFDLEWNSKDQTFDRDLLAMRTYFDCGLVPERRNLSKVWGKYHLDGKTYISIGFTPEWWLSHFGGWNQKGVRRKR